MGIGSVNNYNSIFQNYRVPTIPVISPEELKRQQENVSATPAARTTAENSGAMAEQKKPNALLEDVSMGFRKNDDYGYLGQEADITALDKPAYLGDAQKDNVLRDYQYFVGSSRNLANETPDGLVIPKF